MLLKSLGTGSTTFPVVSSSSASNSTDTVFGGSYGPGMLLPPYIVGYASSVLGPDPGDLPKRYTIGLVLTGTAYKSKLPFHLVLDWLRHRVRGDISTLNPGLFWWNANSQGHTTTYLGSALNRLDLDPGSKRLVTLRVVSVSTQY